VQLLILFVLFPFTFFGVNFGAGWPTIVAIHLEHPSTPLTAAAAVLSIGLAVVLVRTAASFLPRRSASGDTEGAVGDRAKRPRVVAISPPRAS
jgi:hypothetical protein